MSYLINDKINDTAWCVLKNFVSEYNHTVNINVMYMVGEDIFLIQFAIL